MSDDANETETFADMRERKKITYNQKHKMLKFMEKHPKLKGGLYDDTLTVVEGRRLWQELADILNALDGPKKTWNVWKKCYRDMQAFHKKAQIKKKSIVYTKVEPPIEDTASDKDPLEYEKYVYRVIGETSVRRVASATCTTPKSPSPITETLTETVTESPVIKQEPEGVFVIDNSTNNANSAQEQYYKKKLDLMERQTMAFEAIAESMQMQAEAFFDLNESVNNLTSILKNCNIHQNP